MLTLLLAAMSLPNTAEYMTCIEQRAPAPWCVPYRQGLVDGAVSQLRANAKDRRSMGLRVDADALDATADDLERQRDR